MLRSEVDQARQECDQAGEAWARVNDQSQNTKTLWTTQTHRLHEKGLAEVDRCRAELCVVTVEYNQAVESWTRTNDQLQQTKTRWTQRTTHLIERGVDTRQAYADEIRAVHAGCSEVYEQMSINAQAATRQAQQTRHVFIEELDQMRSNFDNICNENAFRGKPYRQLFATYEKHVDLHGDRCE